MFQPGKVLKVKVETAPGEYGFGRATIVDRSGNTLTIQLKTSRDSNKILPKGTRIWFVNDSPRLTFNGMWQSSVLGTQLLKGRTVLVCAVPKLEPASQRRKSQRVTVEMPVTISLDLQGRQKQEFKTVDLCKSGSAIETTRLGELDVETGKELGAVLHTAEGNVSLTARILRVEHNWLANKTSIALEFIALAQESADILDRTLVRLGGQPRDPDLSEASAGAREGMSSWAQQVKRNQTGEMAATLPADSFEGANLEDLDEDTQDVIDDEELKVEE